jgi:hypothetical protein
MGYVCLPRSIRLITPRLGHGSGAGFLQLANREVSAKGATAEITTVTAVIDDFFRTIERDGQQATAVGHQRLSEPHGSNEGVAGYVHCKVETGLRTIDHME